MKSKLDSTMEEFRKMWERDFSKKAPNSEQWIMLSPAKYEEFFRAKIQSAVKNALESTRLEMERAELSGVGKCLDNLWDGSHPSMGERAAKRIERELIYYFGENWTTDMYKFIEGDNCQHKLVKTLKELTKLSKSKTS